MFRGDTPSDQFTAATGVRRALAKPSGIGRHWQKRDGEVDAFDAKADALAVLIAAGAPASALQIAPGAPGWFHPGRSGTIQIGPQNVLGYFGELHPGALEALDADGPLVAFEVILERIPDQKKKSTRAKPALELSPFQPVERDFAFVVEQSVKAADLVRAALGVDRKLITGVTVFDVYEGKGIEPGKKSIAIAVTIQPRDKTMTDAEIEALAAKIVGEVGKRTGGVLRAEALPKIVTMTLEDHALGIGKIIGNLQSFEFLTRAFLAEANRQKLELPSAETTELPETYITNRSSLRQIIEKYNETLSPSEQKYRVDPQVTEIRDAIAHGRLLANSTTPPLTLYKFANVNAASIPIVYRAAVDADWIESQRKLIYAQMQHVLSCARERQYRSIGL